MKKHFLILVAFCFTSILSSPLLMQRALGKNLDRLAENTLAKRLMHSDIKPSNTFLKVYLLGAGIPGGIFGAIDACRIRDLKAQIEGDFSYFDYTSPLFVKCVFIGIIRGIMTPLILPAAFFVDRESK